MSNNPPEIKQGIKRTGSNRDQLLTKAVQDMSGGVAKLLKSVFLACTKPFANHIRGRRKDVRGQLGRRVTQIG